MAQQNILELRELIGNKLKSQAKIPNIYYQAKLEDTFNIKLRYNKSYFFTGKCGSGKSHLAAALANDLINQATKNLDEFGLIGLSEKFRSKLFWQNIPNFFNMLRDFYRGKYSQDSESKIIDDLASKKYLILDDLGAEKISDWTVDRLYLLINKRYENKRHLIITSNLSLDEIANKIHDRLSSRIVEMCEIIYMPDIDRRIKSKEAK